jgi:flagellar M-ring protein FliF
MEFLTRYWTQIRAQLEQLSLSQRWLIAATVAFLLLAGFFLIQYAGQAETTAITPFSSGNGQQVLSRLRAAGIEAEQEGGQIVVPIKKRDEAIALLVQDNLLSEDTAKAFKDLVQNQTPWSTEAQDRRRFLIAKQEVLSRVLQKMQGVRSANVVIDTPQEQGFGSTNVAPSASVSVTMDGGERVDDERVAAIAGLVSGAVAEMTAQNVTIIDSNRGQQYTVDDPASARPGDAYELVQKKEKDYKKKIDSFLQYIPDVVVAVTVQASNVSQESSVSRQFSETEPLESERTQETVRRNIQDGGEPGPRSNTGLQIDGGGGGGTVEETTESETEYAEKNLLQETQKQMAGHQTQQVNVAINVPRSYFVDLYKQNNPDAEDEPTNQNLQPIIDEQLQTIKGQVSPLIQSEKPGEVKVAMYPDGTAPKPTAMAGPGGSVSLVSADWVKTAAMVALALLSLGLMLGMVRKATKQESLPSVEELAGAPPSVSGDEEIVGEAGESEGGMAGVELDEEQLRSRKVAEQISDMIKSNPSEAGTLLSKWVSQDD